MTGGEAPAKTVRADPPLEIFTAKPVALAGVVGPASMRATRAASVVSLYLL
ncbi:MAG TPA: hypothetical protein VGI28_10110 [Stellaceae bacterium]